MRKKILHICLAAAAVIMAAVSASCSKDGDGAATPEAEAKGDPIVFRQTAAAEGEQVSRAALSDKYNTFDVWGYKTMAKEGENFTSEQTVIDKYLVKFFTNSAGTSLTNTNNWEYVDVAADQSPKYWDFDATSYRFFAVAPSGTIKDGDTSLEGYTSGGLPGTCRRIKVSADATNETTRAAAPYISELWFSDNNPANYIYGVPVVLRFMQPFCIVEFRFINAQSESLIVYPEDPVAPGKVTKKDGTLDTEVSTITDISFRYQLDDKKMAVKGTLQIDYPISGVDREAKFSTIDVGSTVSELTKPDTDYPLLPSSPNVGLRMRILVNKTTPVRQADVPVEYCQWRPNTRYTYIFKVSGSAVEYLNVMQAAVATWQTVPDNWEFYNW